MPESCPSPLDNRCSALANFVENTETPTFAHWHGLQVPSSIRHDYGRSQPAIADENRRRAAILIPKAQSEAAKPPFPTTSGDGCVTKQRGKRARGKRARAKSEGNEEPQKQNPSSRKGTSNHYGVRFRKDLGKWVAEIRVAEWRDVDKKAWLGTFDTEDGAARGVDLARKLLKCTKDRLFNLPCPELDLYSTRIPPNLDLTDIANESMFKDVVWFIKKECQTYAASFPPTSVTPTLPPLPQPSAANPNTVPTLRSDCELVLPDEDAPQGWHGGEVPALMASDFDMDGVFAGAFLFGAFDSGSSPESPAPSGRAAPGSQFEVEQSEMEVAVAPVSHDLAAVVCELPQTWPGAAAPSSGAFQLPFNADLQSEQSPFCILPVDGGDMTFFDTLNSWSLQGAQFQFQMDRN